jgi:hypothetical protein
MLQFVIPQTDRLLFCPVSYLYIGSILFFKTFIHQLANTMKIEINFHQRFKAITYQLDKYAEAFAGKPEILAAKTEFVNNTNLIGESLSQLMRPVSTVRSPKQDSEKRMRKCLSQMIGMGLTLATAADNQPLLLLLRTYDKQWQKCGAKKLYEFSLHVYEELVNIQKQANANGLTTEKLSDFQQKVQAYGETLDSTSFQLSDRRKKRQDLRVLIKSNNRILRLQIGMYIRFVQDEYPELYNSYTFLRERKSSKKSSVSEEEPAEIMGTVTDSVTGLPIANANISIVEHNAIETTDADGCYVLEEIPAGTCRVRCYANNYEVPDAFTVKAAPGECLVVDFALKPTLITEVSVV